MSDDIQELLKELQKTYLASIPEKIQAIQNLWTAGDLKLLKTDYHKLKGTGRTYGLPEVTQIGEVMEQIVANAQMPAIHESVPISLELLREVSDARVSGNIPNIENGPKFQRLIAILNAQHGSPNNSKKTG